MSWMGRIACLTSSVTTPGQPLILMYHRVATLENDPWQLAVTPENFREHMRILSERRRVVALGTLVREALKGRANGLAAVTFDDGYLDVLENAVPILAEFQCPATVFIVPEALGRRRGFWWDDLTRVIFSPADLPPALAATTGGFDIAWQQGKGIMAGSLADDVSRRGLYYAIWKKLIRLEAGEREHCIGLLSEWSGARLHDDAASRVMTAEQAVAMTRGGLVALGAHTLTHPSLTTLYHDGQRREILGSRRACEEIAGQVVDTFAFPFGHHNDDSVRIARDAGFAAAVTTRAGTVSPRSNPVRLPRLNIGNFDGPGFRRALGMNFAVPNGLPLSISARLIRDRPRWNAA